MTGEERENALHCLKVMIDEEVCEECKLYGTTGTDHCEADCVRVAIKALEQEPRWIPCSERLPEDRREVLVTAYWHETYQVMMASYFGDGLWWCVPFNNCGEHMHRLKPKAWMPLPEPYKHISGEEQTK